MSFSMLLNDLARSNAPRRTDKIPRREYDQWRGMYLFDAIKGLRYGQSFCNHFDVVDNILYYDDRAETAHRYICKKYVKHGK